MQPDQVTEKHIVEAVKKVNAKHPNPELSKIRLVRFHEGVSVQLMHTGPYFAEGPNIEKLHNFASENGYMLRGRHHEIYLSDPRKCVSEKMKTILRQPIEK